MLFVLFCGLERVKEMKQRGFSLIELVITLTVLSIMTLGVLPLVKISVKRQKEEQLRETLRQIRMAIDEFHRDTMGMVCYGRCRGDTGTTSPAAPEHRSRSAQQSRDQ